MKLRVEIAEKFYGVDLAHPVSLAIPLVFDGPQPGFFGAPDASATAFEGKGFVGDVARGGSCNVSEIRLVPHCNGTHTENAGHIIKADYPVSGSIPRALMPALLVSVAPIPGGTTGDLVIPAAVLAAALPENGGGGISALIVRTLPNDPGKKAAIYDDQNVPCYFTEDAIRHMVAVGIEHLLVDIPSIDKMHDEGRLTNHRLFWDVAPGATAPGPETRMDKTVTEMIFVDDAVVDGLYLLDLQVPAWQSDAVPSNPVLYPLLNES